MSEPLEVGECVTIAPNRAVGVLVEVIHNVARIQPLDGGAAYNVDAGIVCRATRTQELLAKISEYNKKAGGNP